MSGTPERSPVVPPASRPALQIDRCVCMNRLFSDLLDQARDRGFSLMQLIRETGCGDRCGLCRPYLHRMLSTGETVFHQIIEPGAE